MAARFANLQIHRKELDTGISSELAEESNILVFKIRDNDRLRIR